MLSLPQGAQLANDVLARQADCISVSPDSWEFRPDGTHVVRLMSGDHGVFSPDGKRLAVGYSGDNCFNFEGAGGVDPDAGLFVSRANGSGRRRVISAQSWTNASSSSVAWLTNGHLVVAERTTRLVVFEPLTGRKLMTVSSSWLGRSGAGATVSCSGRVAVQRTTKSAVELAIITRYAVRTRHGARVRVAGRRVLTLGASGSVSNLSWSPDGRTLLFVRNDRKPKAASRTSLWTVGADGKNLRRLAGGTGVHYSNATWSPDGARVAVLSSGPVQTEVVMNSNASAAHTVATGDFEPTAWSPDGQFLAGVNQTSDSDNWTFDVINAITGRIAHSRSISTSNLGPSSFDPLTLDWQAIGGHPHCADRGPAPA